MRIYKVYHNKSFLNDLDGAFRCTNHIDKPWFENPNVYPTILKARSTFCGDIIKDPAERMWVVASVGFKEMVNEG